MKRIYITILFTLATICTVFGQQDIKAKSILDKAASVYHQANGIRLDFEGSQKGCLLLKESCFYLNCAGVRSWFDGKTQWSYVEDTEEVTISTPTEEEIQSINPYSLITSYEKAFHYRYAGVNKRNRKQVQEIVLTPKNHGEIQSITLSISTTYEPVYIGILLTNGSRQEFNIISYQTHQNLDISDFRFDTKKYPDADIIDMR